MLRFPPMETYREKLGRIRRKHLNMLVSQYGTQVNLAEALGDALSAGSANYLSQLVTGHRQMNEETARKYEKALNLPWGWFDTGADERDNPRQELHDLLDLLPEEEIPELKALLEMLVRKARRLQSPRKATSRKSAG